MTPHFPSFLSHLSQNSWIKRTAFAVLLSSSLPANQQKEIDKALNVYGKDAGQILNEAQNSLKAALPEVEEYLNNPEASQPQESFFGFGGINPPSPAPGSSCQSCRTQSIESLGRANEQKTLKKASLLTPSSSKEVIVFVSLGMPEASLKQLAYEAQQTGARLVIQGLLNNSFQQTVPKIQALDIALEIDPTLFELFEVTRVPTFIQCKMTSEGAVKEDHDRLTGNISLLAALEKFKSLGEMS